MSRWITERELRNDSDEIVRRVAAGESFMITRRGVFVGELISIARPALAPRDHVLELFANAAPVDGQRLFADLDRLVDQDLALPD